jgi:hypothetical protein
MATSRRKKLTIAENFKGSNEWLDRFKKRHGLEYKSVCGERASVDEGTVDCWKSVTLVRYLEGYKPIDIFNADETGIFFQPSSIKNSWY